MRACFTVLIPDTARNVPSFSPKLEASILPTTLSTREESKLWPIPREKRHIYRSIYPYIYIYTYKGNVVGKLSRHRRKLDCTRFCELHASDSPAGWLVCSVSHPRLVLEMFSMNTECAAVWIRSPPPGGRDVCIKRRRDSASYLSIVVLSIWRRDDTRARATRRRNERCLRHGE